MREESDETGSSVSQITRLLSTFSSELETKLLPHQCDEPPGTRVSKYTKYKTLEGAHLLINISLEPSTWLTIQTL